MISLSTLISPGSILFYSERGDSCLFYSLSGTGKEMLEELEPLFLK